MSVNPFSAQGTITADAWGTGKRNDCYWNIAKNQLGEGASAQEISALTEELIALNNEKAGKAGQRDTLIKDEQAVFLPLEYAIDEIKENVINAQTAYTETTAKVSEMQGKFTEATNTVNNALTGLNTATSEMQAAQAALKGASDDDPSYASLQSALNDAQAKFQEALTAYQDAISAQQETQNELNTATGELETLAQNLQEFQQELQETMDEYNEEKEEYGEELNKLQQEVDNLTQQTQNVETELQNAKTAQENAQTDIDKSQETVNTIFTTNEEGEMELDPNALKTAAEGLGTIPEGGVPGANQGEDGEDSPVGPKEDDNVSDNGDGTWTITHADGTTEIMKKDENGNWVANDAPGDGDGTPYSFKEGDTIAENDDGTVTVTHTDGTTEILTKDDNGNLILKGTSNIEENGSSENIKDQEENVELKSQVGELSNIVNQNYTEEEKYKQIANILDGKSTEEVQEIINEYGTQNAGRTNELGILLFNSLFNSATQTVGGGYYNGGTTQTLTTYSLNSDTEGDKAKVRDTILALAENDEALEAVTTFMLNGSTSFGENKIKINESGEIRVHTGSSTRNMKLGDYIKNEYYLDKLDDGNSDFAKFAKSYSKIKVKDVQNGKVDIADLNSCYQTYQKKEVMFDDFENLYSIMESICNNSSDPMMKKLIQTPDSSYPNTNNCSLESDKRYLENNGRNSSVDLAMKVYTAHIQQLSDYILYYGSDEQKQLAQQMLEKYPKQ